VNDPFNVGALDFSKLDGILPAVVQDDTTGEVLMVGFMNREAVEKTLHDRKATFWSRTKKRLWQKGETSGHELQVVHVTADCDNDSLLIRAIPAGPTCHTGSRSCFGVETSPSLPVMHLLEDIVRKRRIERPQGSYTTKLFDEGTPRIAQKVGEEGVETVIAALQGDNDSLRRETADLVYHLTVLLAERGLGWKDVERELEGRMKDRG